MNNPLIVQSDLTLLLEVNSPLFEDARTVISTFADLIKSPEYIYTYEISPLSLWNAASSGIEAEQIKETLEKFSRFPVPENVKVYIQETINKFGKITIDKFESDNEFLLINFQDSLVEREILSHPGIRKYLIPQEDKILIRLLDRGEIKQQLINIGYPVKDLAPLKDGDFLEINFREKTLKGNDFGVRSYQKAAADTFYGNGIPGTGYGTVILPCGAGKTVVGMTVMNLLNTNTLILAPNIAAVHQWKTELLDKTTLTADDIGEYSGEVKIIKPVTIATYQILTWRRDKTAPFEHFKLFLEKNWGLIIYDEVHLLPAPVFKITAEIQAVRRLGLTATLVREDGLEKNVFSLVGPKRFDMPWKDLEAKGWIAEAICHEIRAELVQDLQINYATADKKHKYRIAAENPRKIGITNQLLEKHEGESIIVIGQYLRQLEKIASHLKAPIITGKTPNIERDQIYQSFREGKIKTIVVSKVANFAIDLPDASVAIQISGAFGSRQEEAQRLGRILRPKNGKKSYFYSIVTKNSVEETFSANRQKFLTEQGYKYNIIID
ncbi:MAG: DEAD/DEAH box helicase [Spirochaetales bacterium]|nr:DEAD/DEAH box helicase [Spirochaetales bacterium]